jgi:hypothetical protein
MRVAKTIELDEHTERELRVLVKRHTWRPGFSRVRRHRTNARSTGPLRWSVAQF